MPDKAVTIILFGPSARLGIPALGEVWTLNRCYDILPDEIMQYVARVFEPHQTAELRDIKAADGKPHIHHLDALGKQGRRIIMQQPHPEIANSEAFPLAAIQARYPGCMFSGGEQFLLAMAIYEGYTHIRLIGMDLSDMLHSSHREGAMYWLGIGAGQGVQYSGSLRMLNRYEQIYGYDYGGYGDRKWTDYMYDLIFEPFPFVVKMKHETWMPVK